MSREKLGQFIRDAREVRDLTQEMLAEQIGYHATRSVAGRKVRQLSQ